MKKVCLAVLPALINSVRIITLCGAVCILCNISNQQRVNDNHSHTLTALHRIELMQILLALITSHTYC